MTTEMQNNCKHTQVDYEEPENYNKETKTDSFCASFILGPILSVGELLYSTFGSVVQTATQTTQQPIKQIACREARHLICYIKKSIYKMIRSALLATPSLPSTHIDCFLLAWLIDGSQYTPAVTSGFTQLQVSWAYQLEHKNAAKDFISSLSCYQ